MNSSEASLPTRLKVGIFSLVAFFLIGLTTVLVNHKPYWWRSCQLVKINVEDATGLKTKSPIRSLGLEIGYLSSVELSETHVTLGICITAPVEILPSTRAYIRGEGFLGDKFVELKPVRYVGHSSVAGARQTPIPFVARISWLGEALLELPSAQAADTPPSQIPVVESGPSSPSETPRPVLAAPAAAGTPSRRSRSREIPVGEESQDIQHLINRVDGLVNEMTQLTSNLRQSINPEQLRETVRQLNKTLENASKTLSPESGLNQTAQRVLAKLEDAVEQLRDQMTRINQGKGSLGRLLNDPTYADEIHEVIQNANKLLNKVNHVRFVVDIGGEMITAFNGSRGGFKLSIYPSPDHYYLLGVSVDPRGRRTETTTSTTPQGGPTTVVNTIQVDQTGLLLTGMVGKIFWKRLDLAIGALYGDGALSQSVYLGSQDNEDRLMIRNDIYSHSGESGIDDRIRLEIRPYLGIYFEAGIESLKGVNGHVAYAYGAGVRFDDEDIKLLFALR